MIPLTTLGQTYNLIVAEALLQDYQRPTKQELIGEKAYTPNIHFSIFENATRY